MSGEGEPETLAEEDPEAQLAAFSVAVNKADTSEEVMEVALIFAEDGVNIWRVWREHPGRARELVGVDVEPTDGLVEKFDRLADE